MTKANKFLSFQSTAPLARDEESPASDISEPGEVFPGIVQP